MTTAPRARSTIRPMPTTHDSSDENLGVVESVGLVLLVVLVVWPRLCLAGFAIVDSHLIRDAFDGWVLGAVGFLLLPWTTLAYAGMWSISSDTVTGAEWVAVGIGLLLDVWTWSAFRRR